MFRRMKSSLKLFFEKTRSRYLFSSDKLSVVLHTSNNNDNNNNNNNDDDDDDDLFTAYPH